MSRKLIFIPGSGCPASVWTNLVAHMEQRYGYTSSRALTLPSNVVKPGMTFGWSTDVAFIRKQVIELADQGHEIVAIGHSTGSVIQHEALSGLGKTQRQGEGMRGGVTGIVSVDGPIVPEGFQAAQPGSTDGFLPYLKYDEQVRYQSFLSAQFFVNLPLMLFH